MCPLLLFLTLVNLGATAPTLTPQHHGPITGGSAWNLQQFNSLVAFGDSYTDENRYNYFATHNGFPPPPGTLLPESFDTPGGGRTWVRYVVQYTGATLKDQWVPQITLYDYAVSGASCSNDITPRFNPSINEDWPSVREYEIPAFITDKTSINPATGQPLFTPALTATDAVYSMWIGTNDLGDDCFFTDSQVPGATLSTYLDCVYTALDEIYATGARYFVLMNLAPLYLAPLYANATEGGVGVNTHPNLTAASEQMKEYVTTVNDVYMYRTPYETLIANRYPGANFALFDVGSLILNIHEHPEGYLNGTQPLNTTGYVQHNDFNEPSPDSFLWENTLHPSEQTDRVIAREFVNVISGNSSYATYYRDNGYAAGGGNGGWPW